MPKKLLFFLIVCCAIPVPCVLLGRALDGGILAFALFGVEAAAPAIASILTTFVFAGSSGLKDFLARCYGRKNPARTLALALVALAGPLAVGFCAKLAYSADAGLPGISFGRLDARKIAVICWALVAEELGWRGFLQPELSSGAKRKALVPLAVGCVWALWHYHYYWLGTLDVPAEIFLVGCVGESFVYRGLTARGGGNVVPASIWHFAGNLALALFAIPPGANGGDAAPYCVYTALMCAIALACLAREFLPRKEPRFGGADRRTRRRDERTIADDGHAREERGFRR